MDDSLRIEYSFFRRFKNVFLFTLFGFLIYYLLGFGLNAGAFDIQSLSFQDLMSYVFIDQFLIESFSVGILFGSVILYARSFKLNQVSFSFHGISIYFLSFLPLALTVFFVINPVTQTLRFLWRFRGQLDWSVYWDRFFFSTQLYLIYTGILIPIIFLALGINLFIQFKLHSEKDRDEWITLKVLANGFDKYISSRDVLWFSIRDRTYYAVTSEDEFQINMTLSELEEVLDPRRFLRINRSTIVNLLCVNMSSHWENGKYIAFMNDKNKTEHVIPRKQVDEFKRRMSSI